MELEIKYNQRAISWINIVVVVHVRWIDGWIEVCLCVCDRHVI